MLCNSTHLYKVMQILWGDIITQNSTVQEVNLQTESNKEYMSSFSELVFGNTCSTWHVLILQMIVSVFKSQGDVWFCAMVSSFNFYFSGNKDEDTSWFLMSACSFDLSLRRTWYCVCEWGNDLLLCICWLNYKNKK